MKKIHLSKFSLLYLYDEPLAPEQFYPLVVIPSEKSLLSLPPVFDSFWCFFPAEGGGDGVLILISSKVRKDFPRVIIGLLQVSLVFVIPESGPQPYLYLLWGYSFHKSKTKFLVSFLLLAYLKSYVVSVCEFGRNRSSMLPYV